MKNLLLGLVALCSCTSLNTEIREDEREVYIGQNIAEGNMYGKGHYTGVDLEISNAKRDFNVDVEFIGNHEQRMSNVMKEVHFAIVPRIKETLYSHCFSKCDSKLSKTTFDFNLSTGLLLDLRKQTLDVAVNKTIGILLGNDSIPIPSYNMYSEMLLSVGMDLRLGIIKCKYDLSKTYDNYWHNLSLGIVF